MYDSHVVLVGQSIKRRVAKTCAHQSATKQDDGIAGRVPEVCIRESMRLGPTCVRVRWKDEGSVEATVGKEFQHFCCRYMRAHCGVIEIGMEQGKRVLVSQWVQCVHTLLMLVAFVDSMSSKRITCMSFKTHARVLADWQLRWEQ